MTGRSGVTDISINLHLHNVMSGRIGSYTRLSLNAVFASLDVTPVVSVFVHDMPPIEVPIARAGGSRVICRLYRSVLPHGELLPRSEPGCW